MGAELRSSLWGLVVGPGSSLQRQLSGWAIAPGSGGTAGAAAGTAASGGLSSARPGAPRPCGSGQGHSQPREGGHGSLERTRSPAAPPLAPGLWGPRRGGDTGGPGTQGHQQPDVGQPAKTRLSPGQAVWVPRPSLLAAHSLHSRFFSRPRFSSRFPPTSDHQAPGP